MDYGKIAYLKTEDLARRIHAVETKNVAVYGSVNVPSRGLVSIGRGGRIHETLFADADGAATVLLRLRIRAKISIPIGIEMRVQGRVVLRSRVVADAGEADAFFMSSAALVRGIVPIEVYLECDAGAAEDAVVTDRDLTAFGTGLRADASGCELSVGERFVCYSAQGRADIYRIGKFDTPYKSIMCDVARIYSGKDGDRVLFCADGVAYGADADGGIVHMISSCAEDIAGCGDGCVILREGEAYLVREGAEISLPPLGERIEKLVQVQGGVRPACIFSTVSARLYHRAVLPVEAVCVLRFGG